MNLEQLRELLASTEARMQEIHVGALDRGLDKETEQPEWDALVATLDTTRTEIATVEARNRVAESINRPGGSEHGDGARDTGPNFNRERDPMDILEDRAATPRQLADAATRSLETKVEDPENMAHVRRVLKRHSSDRDWVRGMILRASDDYANGWWKLINGREFMLTAEERAVLGVTTNANGKFLLPTHLDPTIILTSAMSTNEIRKISRVVTLTDGQPAWNGITSAGVTASWDGEVVEVSDDTPTFGQPSIATVRAQAFVQASISAAEDIANLANDLLMMFNDAKERLEGAAHATGAGTTEPMGVFTAVAAVTASRVVSTTAATIGLVDIHSAFRGVPVRYRARSTWVANPLYSLAVKALGTAVSASYSGDLTEPVAGRILGHPLVESDDAPATQTTTALDQEIMVGDFGQFVIVDRPGDMAVEYIPHLFNTTTNLPDGRRGWYATWRNGSDVTNVNAFRLIVDKTTA
jgi:HK97 family phage major capsid protein